MNPQQNEEEHTRSKCCGSIVGRVAKILIPLVLVTAIGASAWAYYQEGTYTRSNFPYHF